MAILVLSISGCESESTDEKFLSDLESGLVARWKISSTSTVYDKPAQAELDYVQDYKEATFDSSELESLAKEYISAIEVQLEASQYYNSDYQKFAEAYFGEDGLVKRAEILQKLVEEEYITIPADYEESYEDVIASAQQVTGMASLSFGEIELAYDTPSEDFYDFTVFIENNSEQRVNDMMLFLEAYDEKNVRLGEGEIYNITLEPNAKGKFMGQMLCDFKKVAYYKIVSYWDEAPYEFGTETGDLLIPIYLGK